MQCWTREAAFKNNTYAIFNKNKMLQDVSF